MPKHVIVTRWAKKRQDGLRHLEFKCNGLDCKNIPELRECEGGWCRRGTSCCLIARPLYKWEIISVIGTFACFCTNGYLPRAEEYDTNYLVTCPMEQEDM